jgi:hypothetical protein
VDVDVVVVAGGSAHRVEVVVVSVHHNGLSVQRGWKLKLVSIINVNEHSLSLKIRTIY